jgi:hypothetical protein
VEPRGPTEGGPPPARIDLAAVEASLRQVQREFESINERLTSRREPMSDPVVENLLAGYALVNELVNAGVDLFAMGNLKYLLELNTIVLCGTDPLRRERYARHIEATQRHFYEERDGGVQDVVEWYAGHQQESAWSRAAGAYVRILSKPQLFIEGNHRTGALVMSHILLGDGQPPFVLSVENADLYFSPMLAVKDTEKKSPAMLFRLLGVKSRLTGLLRDVADRQYLRA